MMCNCPFGDQMHVFVGYHDLLSYHVQTSLNVVREGVATSTSSKHRSPQRPRGRVRAWRVQRNPFWNRALLGMTSHDALRVAQSVREGRFLFGRVLAMSRGRRNEITPGRRGAALFKETLNHPPLMSQRETTTTTELHEFISGHRGLW